MNQINLIKPHIESITFIENMDGNPNNRIVINKPINLLHTKYIEKNKVDNVAIQLGENESIANAKYIPIYTIYFNGNEVTWWFLNERDRDLHYNSLIKPLDIDLPIEEAESQPD